MKKTRKIFEIIYLIIGALTICEFIFVSGMFTAPIMMLLSAVTGILNIVWEIKERNVTQAALYLLATVALNMAYVKLM